MKVGETISSVGAIDKVMTHLESGLGGRYHSTQFIPSRHQVGYIMSKTKQFEKVETRSSALWRRIE
jgi:hypothetical protein